MVAAILPNLAQWASGLIDNALNAAGTSAPKVGMDALNGAGVVYEGLQTLGEGAVLVGLILGSMVTFVLEKKFFYAAIASVVGAVLSFIGLIHAPQVAWAANPSVALGYLFFGLVCLLYGLLPGAKDSSPTWSPATSRSRLTPRRVCDGIRPSRRVADEIAHSRRWGALENQSRRNGTWVAGASTTYIRRHGSEPSSRHW